MVLRFLLTLIFLLLPMFASGQIKVKEANLQHGTATDGNFVFTTQANTLSADSTDVVAGQEVTVGDIGLWDTAFTANGLTRAVFQAHLGSPGDGNAIWYRSATTTLLQTYTFDMINGINPTSGNNTFGWNGTDARRTIVAAKFSKSGQQFYVVNFHGCAASCEDNSSTNFAAMRVGQIESMLSWIGSTLTGAPVLVPGDYNLPPNYPRAPERTFTASSATDVITSTAHGWANDTAVSLRNSGGAVPGGLAAGDSLYAGATVYYLRDVTADTFKLSASRGGSAIDLTTDGTGSNFVSATQWDLFISGGYTDLWQAGLSAGTATANWGDRDADTIPDMPVTFQTTRTHDSRRIDYIMLKGGGLALTAIDMPDLRATCSTALTATGNFKECPDVQVAQLTDFPDDQGIRPSDHNFLTATMAIVQTPVANAGPDRVINVNEPLVLDGTASSGGFDGLQANGRHSYRWDLGYGSWTYEGGLLAPVVYPRAGTFSATLTVCNGSGSCVSDTALVTVNAITEGTETVVGDSGNPITNGTNLCNALTSLAATNNPVVTLAAGVTYDMDGSACQLPNRTGTGYLTIRSSAHASLPSGTTRVGPADAANMPIVTPGDHPSNPSINSPSPAFSAPVGASPAHHYRFVGINFAKKFSTLAYDNPRAFIDLGDGAPTALEQLPHHIQLDRCIIGGGNTTSATTRGVAIAASDVAVVNSYIYRIQMLGSDVQAVWVGAGERIAVVNNYMAATTENFMTGGSDSSIRITQNTAQATGNDATHIKLAASEPATTDFYAGKGIYIASGTGAQVGPPCPCSNLGRIITAYDGTTKIATVDPAFDTVPDGTSVYRIGEHVATDLVIRRNHMQKDLGWRAADPSYYGVNWNTKNIFELKQGLRISVEGNIFADHWMEDQNWAIVFTTRNQEGRQPWAKISHVDFSHNKVLRVGNVFQYVSSDSPNPSLGMDRVLVRHNVTSGVGTYDGALSFQMFAHMAAGGAATSTIGDRPIFSRNSSDHEGFSGKGRTMEFEDTTRWRNLTVYGNIVQGYFHHSGTSTEGASALAAATGGGAGSYSVTKNGFYTSAGTNPADNTTVAGRADVKYTDVANHNLALQGDSPFLATGPAGGPSGADIPTVNALTIGVVTGSWPEGGVGGGKQKGKVTRRGKAIIR